MPMQIFDGIPASPGITWGKVFIFKDEDISIPHYNISTEETDQEIERLQFGVDKAIEDIEEILADSSIQANDQGKQILDAHLMILKDREFLRMVEQNLRQELKNAEWTFNKAIEDLIAQLESASNQYLQERSLDYSDISRRVLEKMLQEESKNLNQLDEEIILVAHDLLPSIAISMDKSKIKGILLDAGGKTSHTAIIAQSFGIPAVVGLASFSDQVSNDDLVIVDGNSGWAIKQPDSETMQNYVGRQKKYLEKEKSWEKLKNKHAKTKDGKILKLLANIESPDEIANVKQYGADGIGLYRSEFLFLQSNSLPDEEQQYQAYSKVLREMEGQSVTIRTMDIGGDKAISALITEEEKNPLLGWRAIRLCLSRPDIFATQISALLRASVHGNLKVMFPMITCLEELLQILEIWESVETNLRKHNIPYQRDIPLGIMIEVPSAALIADVLAKHVSFFSIGTNDLIQYTVAVDRGNEKIAYLYRSLHPAMLRLINQVIQSAHEAGILVSVCGGMAVEVKAAALLLGMGVDELSMYAHSVPAIKNMVRTVKQKECFDILQKALRLGTVNDVDSLLNQWFHEKYGPIF